MTSAGRPASALGAGPRSSRPTCNRIGTSGLRRSCATTRARSSRSWIASCATRYSRAFSIASVARTAIRAANGTSASCNDDRARADEDERSGPHLPCASSGTPSTTSESSSSSARRAPRPARSRPDTAGVTSPITWGRWVSRTDDPSDGRALSSASCLEPAGTPAALARDRGGRRRGHGAVRPPRASRPSTACRDRDERSAARSICTVSRSSIVDTSASRARPGPLLRLRRARLAARGACER